MADHFRILILSDLHAIDDDSALRTTASMNYAQAAMPRALLRLCVDAVREQYSSGVDLILVAGDMTDKASGGPLAEVWADLQWLAQALGASLVATSGNHDYDSRAQEDALPTKSLMSLEPPFPFGSAADRNKYFAEHHAVFADGRVVVVTANSAAHHGYHIQGSPEHEHGRYPSALPTFLERSLKDLGQLPPIRVFLTHHHLNQLPGFDLDERSFSIGHEEVLRTLLDHGSWLIVHGHKHRGWLQYASGPGDSPPLLSSSSFSADFGSGGFAEKVRHQFHVVEIPTEHQRHEAIPGIYGSVASWTHSQIGWSPAAAGEDLPGHSGFGWKVGVSELASRIRSELETVTAMSGDDLVLFEPRMRYLTFDDRRRLVRALESAIPSVRSVLEQDGRIRELSISRENTI